LLNKICPENVTNIAARIKAEAHPENVKELELVIGSIFKKSIAEPHYCETYADLVYHLKSEMPEFPNPEEGGKPVNFKSSLLNVSQNEFDSMPRSLNAIGEEEEKLSADDLEHRRSAQKKRFLANMKLVGHLFLRKLLATKVIGSIVAELMCCDSEGIPDEHIVEGVCELLNAIGCTMEALPAGKAVLTQVLGRMLDLKVRVYDKGEKKGKGIYSKRVQFTIQDVLDARAAGWARKVFKTTAKTKEEVRQQQERDLKAAQGGSGAANAEFVVIGQRPAYLDDPPVALGEKAPAAAAWSEVPKSAKKEATRR